VVVVASGRTGRFGLLRVCCGQPVNRSFSLLSSPSPTPLPPTPVFLLISFSSSVSRIAATATPATAATAAAIASFSLSPQCPPRFMIFVLCFFLRRFLPPVLILTPEGADAQSAFTKVTAAASTRGIPRRFLLPALLSLPSDPAMPRWHFFPPFPPVSPFLFPRAVTGAITSYFVASRARRLFPLRSRLVISRDERARSGRPIFPDASLFVGHRRL